MLRVGKSETKRGEEMREKDKTRATGTSTRNERKGKKEREIKK